MGHAKKQTPDPQLQALQKQLDIAHEDLRQAYLLFDQVVDEDLIEATIFRMNAALAQCNYLVRAMKELTAPASDSTALAAAAEEAQGAWM